MTLEKLARDWRNYVLENNDNSLKPIVLKYYYTECKVVAMRRGKKEALVFRLRYNDGSWYHEFDILRCDAKGNCYLHTFYTCNINKFYWKNIGRFVKLNS